MNKEEAKGLAKKFLAGEATVDERADLHGWSAINPDDETEVVFTSKQENIDDVKSRLFDHIQAKINVQQSSEDPVIPVKRRLWYRVAVAAAILLVTGTSVYFYVDTNSFFKDDLADAKNIVVSEDMATLTLGNGKKINLSDALSGRLAEESGLIIQKTSEGQVVYEINETSAKPGDDNRLNTITTPKGGQYSVVLPDGSKIWLNAASSISFPSAFVKAGKRKVQLNGEAYFEVAKDKTKPFIVETAEQQLEVLGTHFNVNAYAEEHRTKTTLLEGSVRVGAARSGRQSGSTSILKPGQQSVLTEGNMNLIQADTEEAVAWKNGYFKFNSESLSSIMRKLARWYNVEVVYEGEINKDRFGGTISRYKNLADVLEMLESTKLVKFKAEGRKIIVR